jgi:hypothetical protein|tara:strand:- start:10281 stop:10550 length:270 start_codon:yes stop_codon:yes gene_type:complete
MLSVKKAAIIKAKGSKKINSGLMLNTHCFVHLIDRSMINHVFASGSSVQPAQMKSRSPGGIGSHFCLPMAPFSTSLFASFSDPVDFVVT